MMMTTRPFRIVLLLLPLIAALAMIVYGITSADGPPTSERPMHGMTRNTQGMPTSMGTMTSNPGITPMPPEAWAQMQAMMAAMPDLMAELAAAPDAEAATPIRQQLEAMITSMHAEMTYPTQMPDAAAMLDHMLQYWPQMADMHAQMADPAQMPQMPDAATMADMMQQMPGMMGDVPNGMPVMPGGMQSASGHESHHRGE
jgi:hypothetical protein